jgi:hypothetical protein
VDVAVLVNWAVVRTVEVAVAVTVTVVVTRGVVVIGRVGVVEPAVALTVAVMVWVAVDVVFHWRVTSCVAVIISVVVAVTRLVSVI